MNRCLLLQELNEWLDPKLHLKIDGPLNVMAFATEKIRLNGAIFDPDGNAVSIKWWQFVVGTYPGNVTISTPDSLQFSGGPNYGYGAQLLLPYRIFDFNSSGVG